MAAHQQAVRDRIPSRLLDRISVAPTGRPRQDWRHDGRSASIGQAQAPRDVHMDAVQDAAPSLKEATNEGAPPLANAGVDDEPRMKNVLRNNSYAIDPSNYPTETPNASHNQAPEHLVWTGRSRNRHGQINHLQRQQRGNRGAPRDSPATVA